MQTTNVIVIDDSPTMRAFIVRALETDPSIRVVGTAGDPYEAREAIKRLNPDVVTLDIEMPRMNGLEFLEKIMRLRPMPVVMISSLTQRGAEMAIEALAIGAFDCVGKPQDGALAHAFADLPEIVRAAARVKPTRIGKTKRAKAPVTGLDFHPNGNLIAIGASTGGVDALTTVLSGFPANCPPTVITQHMPSGYTKNFAERLDERCAPKIREASDNAPLKPGHVYIAQGSSHLEIEGFQNRVCRLREGEPVNGHRPSVDVLFRSAARYRNRVVGVLLTGMGRDGAEGLRHIRSAGGQTIGQDEESSIVYGMPRAAFELGAVQRQVSLREIAAATLRLCTRKEVAA